MLIVYYQNKIYMPTLKWNNTGVWATFNMTPGKQVSGDNTYFGWRGINYAQVTNPEVQSYVPTNPAWMSWLTFNGPTQALYVTTAENGILSYWAIDPNALVVIGSYSAVMHDCIEDALKRTGDIKQAIQSVLLLNNNLGRIVKWDVYDVPVQALEYGEPDETYDQPPLTNADVLDTVPPDPQSAPAVKKTPTRSRRKRDTSKAKS